MRLAKFFALLLALSFGAAAQQVVAPTTEPVGSKRGDDWGGYNFTNSFETGYRFATVGGNESQYRSNVNFGNGIRLLAGSFDISSHNRHGRLFDDISLQTTGLGGDPYQFSSLRIRNDRLYEYDMTWRLNDYFNPGLTTGNATSQHLLDTSYQLQDHDLTILPRSKIKFFLGYTRSSQTGAGLSTVQLFDPSGNIFPFFTNVQRLTNEYRLGNEFQVLGFTVNWLRGWQDFKDDSDYGLTQPVGGDVPGNGSLQSFARTEPYHGTSPYWRVALFRRSPWFNVEGRFTYTGGQRAFFLNESALGSDRFGAAANRQILTTGDARRPVATGNLTLSVFASSKLSIVNHTAVYNVRTEGDSTYVQFDNSTQTADALYFQYLGIRTFSNETDASYELNGRIAVHGGYQYSSRRIRSIQQFPGGFLLGPNDQSNQLHAGLYGIRYKPIKPLTITVDGEIGRSSFPFAAKSEGNYQDFSGRIEYKLKNLRLSAASTVNYNTTAVTLTSYSSRSRTYSAGASWSPHPWFSFDASYNKLHLDTLGGIAYFANTQLQTAQSYYLSNIYAVNVGVRLALLKRADLYLGYSHVEDTGDGRVTPFDTNIGPSLTAFQGAQTFPLRFQAPLARLSIRIAERLRWNVGYEYYGYHQQFFQENNYRAHTGYTSLLWSF